MMATLYSSSAGHTYIVTGGSSGIGRAIVDALIADQARVVVISRHHPTHWYGGAPSEWDIEHNWIQADFNMLAEFSTIFEDWLAKEHTLVSGLIHCAVSYGVGARHTFLETEAKEWEEVFHVSVDAPRSLTAALLPQFLAQGEGLILYVSSEVAFNPGPKRIAYSAAKAAAHFIFAGLAEELLGTGVNVVGILPEGMVDTPGIRRRRPPDFDFSSYARPQSFGQPVLHIVRRSGEPYHAKMLVVAPEGTFYELSDGKIASQTR